METFIEKLVAAPRTKTGNVVEYITEAGNNFTLEELLKANHIGYVYHSSQTNIDFENTDENGKTVTDYMDIHYFSFTDPKELHKEQNCF